MAGTAGPTIPGGVNLTRLFYGEEKEHVFPLIPGERRLADLFIDYRALGIIRHGVARATLTTHRVLNTETAVFSPFYWVLLLLFPPAILGFASRVARNRSVSISVDNVDSIEKTYKPNWLTFILAIIVALLLLEGLGTILDHVHLQKTLEGILEWGTAGLLAIVVLVLLLTSRKVGIKVLSRNNRISMSCGSWDRGPSEQDYDAFIQEVYAQIERVTASEGH